MKKTLSHNSYAVIGLGFGDEGKGVCVDSLCQSLDNPLVVRFNGGQQAGHTVTLKDGAQHVFSNFGSGSFSGAPTYWSKYCTFDPVGVVNELNILLDKGIKPVLFIDRKCPVTTPYDKAHNQVHAMQHGTCGTGVGSTYQREEDFYSLLAGDTMFDSVVGAKLDLIKDYYRGDAGTDTFIECCEIIRSYYNFHIVDEIPSRYTNLVFEGAQGLLLDQNGGFFPHVTRSNTGPKNILEMGYEPRLYLMTRAFQTRHGNGPMTNLEKEHKIKDNPYESNVNNQYQGEFKKSLLDLDLLKYAIDRDDYIRTTKNKELVITCIDLMKDEYAYTVKGRVVSHLTAEAFVKAIACYLNVEKVRATSSPYGWIEK